MKQSEKDWAYPGYLRDILWSSMSLVLSALVLAAAGFKENPVFWTNAGGYPVWFRHLIELGFYPTWSLLFFINALIVAQLLRKVGRGWWVVANLSVVWMAMVVHFLSTLEVIFN
jgi:hypothetical protein